MTGYHYTHDIWAQDTRPILAAAITGDIKLAIDGWEFQRFERNGSEAAVPYLRATKDGVSIESPLMNWQWVEFDVT